MHIDDWLDTPAIDDAEKWAKEFLEHCRRPAIDKDYDWIAANPLFCTYKGERWRVLGASRMGDVWLTKHFERVNGYDIRPDVDECSEWGKTPNVEFSGVPAGHSSNHPAGGTSAGTQG